jgi:large subunit ribosomal protein L21
MFAIINTLGRQYKVSEGDQIKVDRIAENNEDAAEGAKVTFTEVLMISEQDGSNAKVGTPVVAGAEVVAKIVEQGRDKKGVAFKKKRRKGYTRRAGFRRSFTTVQIEKIKAA